MPAHPKAVKRFIRQLTLGEGQFAGKPFTLHPFQEQWVDLVFGVNRKTRRRLRREIVLGIGRKNAKTWTTAAIALALLILDGEPGGLVVGAAKKRDQAALMLNAAKRLVNNSAIDGVPLSSYLKVMRDGIYYPELDATYKVIASEAQSEHGLNPHAFIVDEGHAALETSRELYDTLLTAQGVRRDPLAITITTAGPRPAGPMYDLYRYGKQLEQGLREDPDFGFLWYEAAQHLDIDNPVAWRQANPAMGLFLRESFLRKAAKAVLDGRSSEYMFRRLHLNQWTTALERWLPYAKWQACNKPPDIPDGADVYIAMDAALSRDTFGVALVHVEHGVMVENEAGLLVPTSVGHVKVRRFQPERDGEYIDPNEVLNYVLAMSVRYNIVKCAYDPAYMGLLVPSLSERGVPMEAFPQSADRMGTATETFQRLVLDTRILHGDDPVLNEQMAAVGTKPTDRGVRISKQKSGLPIDVVAALVMALQLAMGEEETEPDDFAFVVDPN